MTDCVASPRAVIAEPIDFLGLMDFTHLLNFAELTELMEKDQTPRKKFRLTEKRELLSLGKTAFKNWA